MIRITREKIIELFVLLELFVAAFVELETAAAIPIQVFHINVNKLVVGVIVAVCILLLLLLLGKVSINSMDKTFWLLIAKVILDIIIYMMYKQRLEYGNFLYILLIYTSMPIVYYVCKLYSGQLKKIIDCLSLYGLVITIQAIVTVVINGYDFSSVMYKTYLRIPMGYSNIIGVTLLTIYMVRFRINEYKKKIDRVIDLILILGIILTNSMGALLFLIIWWLIGIFRKLADKKHYSRIAIICFFICLVGIIFIASESMQIALLDTSLRDFDLNNFSSGRVMLWFLAMKTWSENFWFGTGLAFTSYDLGTEIISTGSHSMILDIGTQSGFVGLFLMLGAIVFAVGNRQKYKNCDSIRKACRFGGIIMFIYSLVEVTNSNYPSMLLMWMLIGLSNSSSLVNKNIMTKKEITS